MSEAKHSPGPWRLIHGRDIYAADDEYIADVRYGVRTTRTVEQNAANARLIAAAPELLAACKLALGSLYCRHTVTDTGDICGVTYTCTACQVRPVLEAAIAAAEGRA